jgi:prevent-host-death family protein
MDITKDIQPLTTFRNNSVEFMHQLKLTQRPIILTVNGKPEAVLQDAAAYSACSNSPRSPTRTKPFARALKRCAKAGLAPGTKSSTRCAPNRRCRVGAPIASTISCQAPKPVESSQTPATTALKKFPNDVRKDTPHFVQLKKQENIPNNSPGPTSQNRGRQAQPPREPP